MLLSSNCPPHASIPTLSLKLYCCIKVIIAKTILNKLTPFWINSKKRHKWLETNKFFFKSRSFWQHHPDTTVLMQLSWCCYSEATILMLLSSYLCPEAAVLTSQSWGSHPDAALLIQPSLCCHPQPALLMLASSHCRWTFIVAYKWSAKKILNELTLFQMSWKKETYSIRDKNKHFKKSVILK